MRDRKVQDKIVSSANELEGGRNVCGANAQLSTDVRSIEVQSLKTPTSCICSELQSSSAGVDPGVSVAGWGALWRPIPPVTIHETPPNATTNPTSQSTSVRRRINNSRIPAR